MFAVGICASYLYYGILQEQLFSEAQVGASFLLLTQCFSNTLVALLWQRLDRVLVNSSTSIVTKTTPINDKTRQGQLHHPLLLLST